MTVKITPESIIHTPAAAKPYMRMDGKHCGNCKRVIKYNYNYCPFCGRKVLKNERETGGEISGKED